MHWNTFTYEAQTPDGQPMRGTIDAADAEQARKQLESLGLRIQSFTADAPPRATASPPVKAPLSGSDFAALNEQLARLTQAGLPIERGLRLIADDLRSGRLKSAVQALADQLEQGQSLDQAFAANPTVFHPLYGQIIDAGIRSGNLPAVLLSLGRHLQMTQRLRTALVRAIAYPMMVLLATGLVMCFLGVSVFPRIVRAYQSSDATTMDFNTWQWVAVDQSLPLITWVVSTTASFVGPLLMLLAIVVLALPLVWQAIPGSGVSRGIERLMWRLPLVGPVLRRSLIARWLDTMHVATGAGIDLPRAITLARGAVPAAPLQADSQQLLASLEAGRELDSVGPMRWLPQSVPAVLQVAARAGNLPEALSALADSHQQQADQGLAIIPAKLTPLLMSILALLITGVLLALIAPITEMLNWMAF